MLIEFIKPHARAGTIAHVADRDARQLIAKGCAKEHGAAAPAPKAELAAPAAPATAKVAPRGKRR